jgi:hypothetical protein
MDNKRLPTIQLEKRKEYEIKMKSFYNKMMNDLKKRESNGHK